MKQWKKICALSCAAALVISNLSACAGLAEATGNLQGDAQSDLLKDAQSDVQMMEDALGGLADAGIIKHSSTAGKEETVYVMMDADGNITSTIVSEWLKNPDGATELTDTSSLTDIRAVKGTATCTQEGDRVTWNADGGDVYYQGQSDAALPVSVSVSYELDGKKVTAKELEGASGHLKISFHYENNTATERLIHGEMQTIYQPFMVISGLVFDNDKASNVEVSDGKVLNSGDMTLVLGMAMPGLSESLGLDDLEDADGEPVDVDIPEQVEIDADVVDFSLLMTMSVATNDALEELGLDDFDSLDSLKDKTDDLTEGMDDIIDGATQLDDGVVELSDGTDELSDGTDDLYNGAFDLADGAHELLNGTHKLNSGADKVKDGTVKVNTGAQQVNTGAAALKEGIDQLKEKAPELAEGVTALVDGADALSEGVTTITSNNETLNSGAAALAEGLNTLDTALSDEEAQEKLTALTEGSSTVNTGLQTVSSGLDAIVTGYDPEGENLSVLISTLETYAEGLAASEDEQDQAMAGAITTMLATYQGMYNDVSTASENVGTLSAGYSAIDEGITSAVGNLQTVATNVGTLSDGAAALQTGVSDYTAGVSSVVEGVGTLKGGLDTLSTQLPNLVSGIDTLSAGASDLSDGTSELAKGTSDLKKGAKDLAEGTGDLADGALELAEGAGKLSDGTVDLKDGVQELVDGVAELLDGTGELKDGVIKFNDEGVSKIADLVNDDVDGFYDRLNAVRDYAKEYNSYAGVNEGTDCSVKFVYKTEGI